MKTIRLDCHGIVVYLGEDGSSKIHSNLKETDGLREDEAYNFAVDGIESLILAHVCAGIDITTPAYIEAIEAAVQSCADNL